ncbi:hypothetical protein BRC77_11530 [Halobacteriales archaeon QH_8_64_26]|nr:MAG: hypothetical protein BRC77_11530 [Halobacteriales archaeon QH_8_64_26]
MRRPRDHATDDGRCRFALEHAASDPDFVHERRREDHRKGDPGRARSLRYPTAVSRVPNWNLDLV